MCIKINKINKNKTQTKERDRYEEGWTKWESDGWEREKPPFWGREFNLVMEVLGVGGVTEEAWAALGWSCGKGDGLQHCGKTTSNHNTGKLGMFLDVSQKLDGIVLNETQLIEKTGEFPYSVSLMLKDLCIFPSCFASTCQLRAVCQIKILQTVCTNNDSICTVRWILLFLCTSHTK